MSSARTLTESRAFCAIFRVYVVFVGAFVSSFVVARDARNGKPSAKKRVGGDGGEGTLIRFKPNRMMRGVAFLLRVVGRIGQRAHAQTT